MSNQAVRNSRGVNVYSPNEGAKDTLTIVPNVILSPASSSFGWIQRSTSPTGSGVFMNELNGGAVITESGVTRYDLLQNQSTLPYYAITANSGIEQGSTLIHAKTNNVLAITAVIPMVVIKPGAGADANYDNLSAYLAIVVRNSDGSEAAHYAGDEFPLGLATNVSPPLASTACQVRSISATIRLKAGQYAIFAVYAATATPTIVPLRYQDKPHASTPVNVVQRCHIDIQKM